MDLLYYFYFHIFHLLDVPSSNDICDSTGMLQSYCHPLIIFNQLYTIILLVSVIILSVKPKLMFNLIIFSIFSILTSFILSDHILKELSDPQTFGIELYIISFYSWFWLIANLFAAAIIFWHLRIFIFYTAFVLTSIFTYIFTITGRGTFEHIKSLIGETMFEFSWFTVLESKILYLAALLFLISLLWGVISVAASWVRSGNIKPDRFFRNYKPFALWLLIILIPIFSYPFGKLVNMHDVKQAKNFINKTTKYAEKRYFENGQYPKIINDYLDEIDDKTPWLLKRHEYFSHGIEGTYYLSRPKKYCYIFQNPAEKPGYYTLTSMRKWRFNASTQSIEDVFVKYCDEVDQSHDELITKHLGLTGPDDYIGQLMNQFNVPFMPATSKAASQKLHKKIMDYGEEDPDVFNYYRRPKEEQE